MQINLHFSSFLGKNHIIRRNTPGILTKKIPAVTDDLADRACMSRSSLNRKMHDLFNLSAKDFLQAARIKHASQLLRTTDMAAKEVAYSCGFTDPKYFAKCFKSSTGQTPTEYRTQAE